MKNIWTIFKKEWDRVVTDKRLILTVFIMPGLMIFLIYTFIGSALQNAYVPTSYNIAIVNPQPGFSNYYTPAQGTTSPYQVTVATASEVASYEAQIDNKTWDLLIVFSDGFATYDGTGTKPTVSMYSNPNEIVSTQAASTFQGYLSQYQQALVFQLYSASDYFSFSLEGTPEVNGGVSSQVLSGMLPMLIVMFLFAGAMSIGPESIAGEKERGTIATLLVTPVKRSQIAIGKILSLSVLALISAASSFIGIITSLPKMLSVSGNISISYSFVDYLMILLVLFSTVFVIVGIISIISAYAKSLKEATSLILPVYIVTILIAVSSMFSSGTVTNLALYLLPLYNTVQLLNQIFAGGSNILGYLLVTVGANLVYLTLLIYILNRMFNSEKVMFNK